MSASADGRSRRMCACGCGPIPPNKRRDSKWVDHATCPQRAKDRVAMGLRPTDDPDLFWGRSTLVRRRRPAVRA